MKDLLKEGDVILLEKGMKVYSLIPKMFVYLNRKTSKDLVSQDIVVGKKYENDTDIKQPISNVINNVQDSFGREGFKIDLDKVTSFVKKNIDEPTSQKFKLKGGEFIVVKTSFEGGSHGGGHDDYPDGHRVYCKRLNDGKYDPNGEEVNFYQSGSFTAMIIDIKPIRQMKKEETYSLTFS